MPYDDIACARVLSAPAWHLTAEDLVRLAERAAKKRGTALYDVLQAPQSELPFDASHTALPTLLEFLGAQRKTLRRRTAREILGDLVEWLEVPQRAATQDRKYVNQLGQFVKEWEAKSETRGLPEFLEYLDYFEQAGGTLSLEDDAPGDAVQLMTVHGAKGLEFPHVFLLRVNSNAFPPRNRSPLFEFPDRLMKEELPQGDFHIQEERRLFYVALTRAMERLTITTLTEKKGKVPVFVEDIVMEPAIKRRDVLQLAPKKKTKDAAATNEQTEARAGELFGDKGRAAQNLLAHRQVGGGISSADAGAIEAQQLRGGKLPEMPAAVCLQLSLVAERRAAGNAEFRQRDAHDHQALPGATEEGREASLRRKFSASTKRNGATPAMRMNTRKPNTRKMGWNN